MEEGQKNENGEAKKPAKSTEWSNPIEFLLSCIAMSVGLGNVWRFPTVAFENGGGAFLIPYLLILTFVGRPMYFMELGLGQFSSSGPVKLWKLAPAFKGVGWGQLVGTTAIVTYYCSLMGLSLFYIYLSCNEVLPWSVCSEEFADMDTCVSSGSNYTLGENNISAVSSAEYFFYNYVLQQPDNINNGLGTIDWRLTICLFLSWLCIFFTLSYGVQSSGKVAYFTAIFPYVVLITLLIRGATLPGSGEGMLYFITPQWEKLLEMDVWYNAITQSFFSLSVSYGAIPMFASHNKFSHNVYRDAWIISLADTFTSILAGLTIFSIIGNLKYELGADDIADVVSGGPGLAFVSYPAAIAKFTWVPQLFAVLFFLMLFTLGLGSASALAGMVNKVLTEQFPKLPSIIITAIVCIVGFTIGLVYVTPSGMIVLDLVDAFGGNIVIFLLAILEVVGVMYIYGITRFCQDMKFMLNVSLGYYWKVSWGFIIPFGLTGILVYTFVTFKNPTYTSGLPVKETYEFPKEAIIGGWCIFALAISFILINFCRVVYEAEEKTLKRKIASTFKPHHKWGPKNDVNKEEWKEFVQTSNSSPFSEKHPNLAKLFKKDSAPISSISGSLHKY